MKLIIIAMIANASLFAFEWDHVRGICESKNECGEIITISHIKHGDMDWLVRVKNEGIDMVALERFSDDIYHELKGEYAHFYIGTDEGREVCIASKYEINPYFDSSGELLRFNFEGTNVFDALWVCSYSGDEKTIKTEKDKEEDKKPVISRGWELSAKGDAYGNITVQGSGTYKKEDEESSVELAGTVAVSRDQKGEIEGEVSIIIRGEF